MKIDKVSVVNNKTIGVMATDFEDAASYLKNFLDTTRTTHLNLSAGDTYLENKIATRSK